MVAGIWHRCTGGLRGSNIVEHDGNFLRAVEEVPAAWPNDNLHSHGVAYGLNDLLDHTNGRRCTPVYQGCAELDRGSTTRLGRTRR